MKIEVPERQWLPVMLRLSTYPSPFTSTSVNSYMQEIKVLLFLARNDHRQSNYWNRTTQRMRSSLIVSSLTEVLYRLIAFIICSLSVGPWCIGARRSDASCARQELVNDPWFGSCIQWEVSQITTNLCHKKNYVVLTSSCGNSYQWRTSVFSAENEVARQHDMPLASCRWRVLMTSLKWRTYDCLRQVLFG